MSVTQHFKSNPVTALRTEFSPKIIYASSLGIPGKVLVFTLTPTLLV